MKRTIIAAVAALLLAGCGSASHPAASASASLASWENGTGGMHLDAVKADLNSLAGGDITVPEGNRLAADAAAAMNDAPPVAGVQYVFAMTEYAQAGRDVAAGDYTDAATDVVTGDDELILVIRAVGGSL